MLGRLLGLPPASTRTVRVEANLAVPMREGTVLRADRYIPDGDQAAPLVLMRTPYGRKGLWARLWARPFADRGYQVLLQSCRGTEDSAGELTPFAEREDGHDTVAWLRAQPWYPGRFATFGASYGGLAQWALADAAPGDLAAMAASVTSAQLARSMFVGGALWSGLWLRWSALVAAQQQRGYAWRTMVRSRALDARRLRRGLRRVPPGEADRLAAGRRLPWWQDWLAHPDPEDAYWQRLDYRALVPEVGAPVLMVTGWDDLFLPWQLADWAALPEDADKRLVVGPWAHGHPAMIKTALQEALGWFDLHLRGRGPGPGDGPVRYCLTGAEEWRNAPTWPPPEVAACRWYAHAGGRLSPAEPEGCPPSRYRYDPADPTPALGGPALEGKARVRQDAVEAREDVLTFTSEALEAPLEVVGAVHALVCVRSTADADVVVRLCEVDRNGHSVNLCQGIRRLAPGEPPEDEDRVRRVEVQLWPTAHRFARGHRLRLQIASAAFPDFARNPGTGEPVANPTALRPSDQEVYHEPGRATHLTLPVAGSAGG